MDHVKLRGPVRKSELKTAKNKLKYINERRSKSWPRGLSYSYRINRAKRLSQEKINFL